MKLYWVGAGTAWAGIVALGWWLADNRIAICGYDEPACKLRATAARDDIMVWGAGLGLAALLLLFAVRAPPASERSVGSQRPHRTALLVRAMKVRARAIRFRGWRLAPAVTAGALLALFALLGWSLWGGQGGQSKEGPWRDFQVSRQTPVEGDPYATYEITAPDGKTYRIDGPDGATAAQVRQQVLSQFPAAGSDPYAAISRSYDDLIPAQAGGKPADPFDHLIPVPKAPKLTPEPENPYASLIPPASAPAPAQPVEPRPGE